MTDRKISTLVTVCVDVHVAGQVDASSVFAYVRAQISDADLTAHLNTPVETVVSVEAAIENEEV